MGVEFAAERRLLTEDEIGPVISSHYPALAELPADELAGLARWLRERHARARDLIRGRRRVHRGKAEARGTAAETASDAGLGLKKQVFARGLKRVNNRLAEEKAKQRRARMTEGLRAALARRQAAAATHPDAGDTAHAGARAKSTARRRGIVTGGRIGSVSQAGRVAQAGRDSRG
jgi:hypothetical protein